MSNGAPQDPPRPPDPADRDRQPLPDPPKKFVFKFEVSLGFPDRKK
ncbi:MAG TPA: hypothetical protein VKB80_07755 [Kofleriaceae bacterium]|nr:hypothetical protein [Kofleriaceae bacterium]